jgi:pimeloyl-ACP methyl ester carboxylesterase
MKAYFISGLAADSRVFRHIHLPEGYETIFLDWIQPLKNESLQDYSVRLGEKIDSKAPFVLIGLSMGGMIAVEIAKAYRPAKTILISSIADPAQLPPYLKFFGKLGLHRIVPVRMIKVAAKTKRLFTTETEEDKDLLRQIIQESDDHFVRWGMDAILKWKTENQFKDCVHIHGTIDEILPIRYTKPTHRIKKAGHMMVMNRAKEINSILEQELNIL